jgi:hypothetical protein
MLDFSEGHSYVLTLADSMMKNAHNKRRKWLCTKKCYVTSSSIACCCLHDSLVA